MSLSFSWSSTCYRYREKQNSQIKSTNTNKWIIKNCLENCYEPVLSSCSAPFFFSFFCTNIQNGFCPLDDHWWQSIQSHGCLMTFEEFFSAPLSSPFFRSLLTAFASEDLDQLRFSSLRIKSKTWSHHSLRDYQCSGFISTWRSNTNIWQRQLLCDSDNQQWVPNSITLLIDQRLAL